MTPISSRSEGSDDEEQESEQDDHSSMHSPYQQLSIFEKIEQLIIICPNSFMFQLWIFLITLLGTASSLFYVFCAVIRKDLEYWEEPSDHKNHESNVKLFALLQDTVLYIELIFLL